MKIYESQPSISLHGSYYGHNFGDVLILSIFRNWVKNYKPDLKVHLPFASDTLTKIIGADANNGFKSIKQSQSLVYCGGGYLGEPNVNIGRWSVRNILRHIPPGEFARINKKPYAIIGVGAGPITNAITRNLMVRICNNARFVAVRDQESYNYLKDYGVFNKNLFITTDVVLNLRREDIKKNNIEKAKVNLSYLPYKKIIGIHLPGNRKLFGNINLIKNAIIDFARRNKDIGFVLLSDSYSRLKINDEIHDLLQKQSVIMPYSGPIDLVTIISLLDMVISTKLHVCITAIAMDRLALSFPLHSKTKRFF